MVAPPLGQPVTAVQPGLGEPGSISGTVPSSKGLRGMIGGWLLRAKTKAAEAGGMETYLSLLQQERGRRCLFLGS